MNRYRAGVVILGFLVGSCSGEAGREAGEERDDVSTAADLPVDTLVTTASGVLGDATDLEVTSDGTLLVLDRLNGLVHRIGSDGRYAGTFAGAGAGPSELSRPSALAPGRGDTIWVADSGNGRLQAYTAAGEHLAVTSAHGWIAFPSHITRDGRLLASAAGQDTMLAALFDREGERVGAFGRAPAPFGSGAVRMSDLAAMIADGEVPPVFRNTAFPFVTASGDVWLSRAVDGVLERYHADPSGSAEEVDHAAPAVRIQLEEPEMPLIRERWLAENRGPESSGVSVLLYVADIYATDDNVWVLLNQPLGEPAVLLRFARSGERLGRWTLPQASGASRLAVDSARGRLYLGIGELAQVIELPLPS